VSRRLLAWVIPGIMFAIGCLVGGVLGSVDVLHFDKRVDVLGLSTLVATVAISAVFYRKFARHQYSDQLRKDALLRRLRESFENVCALEECCESKPLMLSAVVSALKICGREFRLFVEFSRTMDPKNSPAVSQGAVKEHAMATRDINRLLTWTTIGKQSSPPVAIQNGVITLSGDRRVEVELRIQDLKRTLLDVEIAIIVAV